MTSSILNYTHTRCIICKLNYEENEINNTTKTLELVCNHVFHISCYREHAKYRKKLKSDTPCPCCHQVNLSKAELLRTKPSGLNHSSNWFAYKEVYQERLKRIKENYTPNDCVTITMDYLETKHPTFFNLYEEALRHAQSTGKERLEHFIQTNINNQANDELRKNISDVLLKGSFFSIEKQAFLLKPVWLMNCMSKRQFVSWLQNNQELDDPEVISYLSNLYGPLKSFYQELTDHFKSHISLLEARVSDYVRLDTNIPNQHKNLALEIISKVILGPTPLKTIDEEAKMWIGKVLSNEIMPEGFLVEYPSIERKNHFSARISTEHLKLATSNNIHKNYECDGSCHKPSFFQVLNRTATAGGNILTIALIVSVSLSMIKRNIFS